jgi:hypothetical protein
MVRVNWFLVIRPCLGYLFQFLKKEKKKLKGSVALVPVTLAFLQPQA